MGHKKLLYAEDELGRYVKTPSSGWQAEEIVLEQAIAEYDRLAAEAWQAARAGKGSTLAYYMYRERMDATLLAQSTGFMRWRVRRDLRPGAFAKLKPARRQRYGEALGKSPAELDRLPERP